MLDLIYVGTKNKSEKKQVETISPDCNELNRCLGEQELLRAKYSENGTGDNCKIKDQRYQTEATEEKYSENEDAIAALMDLYLCFKDEWENSDKSFLAFLATLRASPNLPAVYEMVTKDRLAGLIGQEFSATEKTALQELRKLAKAQEIFNDMGQCGENYKTHVFECIFGTYKTKVIFLLD